MKMSLMPAGAGGSPGVDLGNINIGVTASAEKLAAAKAVAQGQEKPDGIDSEIAIAVKEELERVRSPRRIKMTTNYSTNRDESAPIAQAEVSAPAAEGPVSTISDKDGQAQAAVESTQPLSPQFAALAKERRQLQVMKQELAKEREAIAAAKTENPSDAVSKADLLANPLKIFELGLTYDQLTEAILANQNSVTPAEFKAMRDELKALKEGIDGRFTSQAQAQEEAALNSIADEIEALSKDGDTYELIRSRKAIGPVLDKIYKHYKKTGEVLDTRKVMDQVEAQLLDQYTKLASIGKVKSKIAPQAPVQTPPQSQGNQMKTLTNRDGAATLVGRRARAIAAFNGTQRG